MHGYDIDRSYDILTKLDLSDLYDTYRVKKQTRANVNEKIIFRQPIIKKALHDNRLIAVNGFGGSKHFFNDWSHAKNKFMFRDLPIDNDLRLVILVRSTLGMKPDKYISPPTGDINYTDHHYKGGSQMWVDITIDGKTRRVLATYSRDAKLPINSKPPAGGGQTRLKDDVNTFAWYTIKLADLYYGKGQMT